MRAEDKVGLSFAEITASLTRQPQSHTTQRDPAQLPAAGSGATERLGQTSWVFGHTGTKLTAKSETRAQYKPPPAGTTRQEPVKPPPSQIPRPDYPTVLKSVTQEDYRPHVLQAGPPQRGHKLRDSGSPLPAVQDKPDFVTQSGTTFKAHSQEEWRAANSKSAGCPATHAVSYNIIHGGPVKAVNPNEAWVPGHDYRRTRP